MPRTRYRFLPGDPYPNFITASTVNWLVLFSNPDVCAILLNSLQFLIENRRIILHAYVIMENHLHLVLSAEKLANEIANFKSFTARKCIDYYTRQQNQFVLNQLSFYKLEYKCDRQYQFWQEGSHPERITSIKMLQQKIDYTHFNPVGAAM